MEISFLEFDPALLPKSDGKEPATEPDNQNCQPSVEEFQARLDQLQGNKNEGEGPPQ